MVRATSFFFESYIFEPEKGLGWSLRGVAWLEVGRGQLIPLMGRMQEVLHLLNE